MAGIPAAEFDRFLVAERLASDSTSCPVRYDVWREYALHGPQIRPQLILERAASIEDSSAASGHPPGGTSPTRVEKIIKEMQARHGRLRGSAPGSPTYPPQGVLAQVRGSDMGVAEPVPDPPAVANQLRPAYFGDWILVRPNLTELITIVLPFTTWGSLVKDALAGTEAEFAITELLRPPSDPQIEYAISSPLRRQQSWLFRLLARIWGNDPDLDSERVQAGSRLRQYLGADAYRWADDLPHWYDSWAGLISSVNLDRPVSGAISQSSRIVKADVARNSFDISCANLTWAVIDSGIDARHLAFRDSNVAGKFSSRVTQVLDFNLVKTEDFDNLYHGADFVTELEKNISLDLPADIDDEFYLPPLDSHGTHVAGILGGDWSTDAAHPQVRGICPDIKLWDLRVIGESAEGLESRVLMALVYLRERNAQTARIFKDGLRIVGANISLSVPYNPHSHACGWTPVCREVRRLVRSGVVVVAAAGNTGFDGSRVGTDGAGTGFGTVGITDPGNSADAITVGATGRLEPTRYGASYFSSKGPTADGRPKPDLLAPGQGIFSAAGRSDFVAKDGTSQAAPHVSGAAALLMARNSELVGDPERIKTILCDTATDLNRERAFQGHGLLDIFRALQRV